MLLKNAAQKIHVYAYNSTTGAPVTGDAANITAYVSLDGTSNVTDTANPTQVDATNMPGVYYFSLTAAETNCDAFALYAKSITQNVRIEPIIGFTTAGTSTALTANAIQLGGTTQAGRDIGASVLLAADQAVNVTKFGGTAVTARDIGASVLVGDKTGFSLVATTGLGNQTANITGNLSGSVGPVTTVDGLSANVITATALDTTAADEIRDAVWAKTLTELSAIPIPLDWRWLANGYLDELLYVKGIVNRAVPFTELKKRSYINPKAQAVAPGGDFSGVIRQGLPPRPPPPVL